jgi:hypothetical protein
MMSSSQIIREVAAEGPLVVTDQDTILLGGKGDCRGVCLAKIASLDGCHEVTLRLPASQTLDDSRLEILVRQKSWSDRCVRRAHVAGDSRPMVRRASAKRRRISA